MKLPALVPAVRRDSNAGHSVIQVRPAQVINCVAGQKICGDVPNQWCCNTNLKCGSIQGECNIKM